MTDGLNLGDWLSILLFASVIGTLMIGYPIAITLAGTSLIFAWIGHAFGVFDYQILGGLPSRYLGSMINEVLVAVPLFIFMGLVLERSGIAEMLLTTMGQLFGKLRGGLAYSVVLVGALLAASTGVVGATVVTMGLISLPAMLRAGYDPKVATGTICASATLAQIIPPSTVLIFVGDLLAGVNQAAQLRMGNFSPDPISVGDLFAGALLPGILLCGLYMLWIVYKAIFQPETVPALKMTEAERRGLPRRVLLALIPPLALIVAVLGSILAGVATPTESASIGAIGALLLAAMNRRLSLDTLTYAARSTMVTTSIIFVIVLAASLFSLVFRGLGGEHLVEQALSSIPGGAFGAMLAVMLIMFVLGFFLDTFEIILIVLPICGPALIMLGLDPLWIGVMIGVNLQTSFLTPPFGFTLFYMRGIAPPSVTTGQIWMGAIPFVFLQLFTLSILWAFPPLATWLPGEVFRQAEQTSPGTRLGPGGINSMIDSSMEEGDQDEETPEEYRTPDPAKEGPRQ
ncbi:tripartite ATP-independent transporter DctM subunit [Stella humosa]|uniref:TRAP transporter large permease protein n=1 Tax=Stella humosa TaxID=94 RepID=A0A3N1KYG8_9PROT|nr:TRAP transporter large permease subunit [Stella humosa]ROP83246.1 tripartite ATP-independent transporter DctM subunit [Stella humosa]BBK29972.1 C4-dicarboxylate ABC transporter [Stella humosa]